MPSETLTSFATKLGYGDSQSSKRNKKKFIDQTKEWVNFYENPEKCTPGSLELKKMVNDFLDGNEKCEPNYILWENYRSFHLQWPRDSDQ
jgi:hypothetical protein